VVGKGLEPGENVVVEGMQKLRQGMAVKTQAWKIPPGFAEDPTLPAPSEPKDGNFDRLPPKAALEGAPSPEVPVAPAATASPAPATTPEPAASPAAPAN
jgi:hypothetical protein